MLRQSDHKTPQSIIFGSVDYYYTYVTPYELQLRTLLTLTMLVCNSGQSPKHHYKPHWFDLWFIIIINHAGLILCISHQHSRTREKGGDLISPVYTILRMLPCCCWSRDYTLVPSLPFSLTALTFLSTVDPSLI